MLVSPCKLTCGPVRFRYLCDADEVLFLWAIWSGFLSKSSASLSWWSVKRYGLPMFVNNNWSFIFSVYREVKLLNWMIDNFIFSVYREVIFVLVKYWFSFNISKIIVSIQKIWGRRMCSYLFRFIYKQI